MTEETGEAAEERRRIARAEIMRRAAILESRRRTGEPLESFDSLVDEDGKLRTTLDIGNELDTEIFANSTAIDGSASQPVWRGGKQTEVDSATSDRGQLHLDIPDASSHHPSESILEFTPTSEAPPGGTPFDPFVDSPRTTQSPVSVSVSSHTDGHSEVYYAHPSSAANASQQQGLLLADLNELSHGGFHPQNDVSAAPSTAGSFSHVGKLTDASSDGTMSDLGERSVGGVATPSSWSEVGSVISSDDANHHPLL